MNVAEILQSHAENSPDQVALIDVYRGHDRLTTFGELDQAVGRLVTLFRQAGLVPGDTVLVFERMSLELYVTLAAIFRLGLTAMFVDPSAGHASIDRCCGLRPPKALVASSRAHLLRLTTPALRRIPLKFSIGFPVPGAVGIERADRLKYDSDLYVCSSETAALASFTSGTSGSPKLALRSHGFLLAQHRAIAAALALEPHETELVALPIFVLANLASRVASILPTGDLRRPDAIDPAPLVAQISRHRPSRAAAPPAFFERIVKYCEARSIELSTLQKIFTGGGPVPPRLLDRLQNRAREARITVVYGATEAEPISTISYDEISAADHLAMSGGRGLLAGRPVPSIKLRVLRDRWGTTIAPLTAIEFDQLRQPTGGPGEIVVSGEHVLTAYADGQGNHENKFLADGTCWHRTGDAGYLDEQGRLWLLGPCAARLDDQDGRLYSLGIEQAALKHAAIRRAALVSVRGERVLAVELNDPLAKPEWTELRKSLAFARIDAVRVVKQIPVDRRHNTKIDHVALCAALERSR